MVKELDTSPGWMRRIDAGLRAAEPVDVTLDPAEAALLDRLLDIAADQFSNHGCNDFDVSGKEAETAFWLLEAHDEDPPDPPEHRPYRQDWILMRCFARKLRGEAPKR